MRNPSTLAFDDFYFNGHWLSEFNGIIAGTNDLAPLSSKPSEERHSEKIPNRHGELYYGTTLTPRTFSIPIVFMDMSKLRDISAWLYCNTPQDFYFKDDTIKIKCAMDSGAVDIASAMIQGTMGGTVELKFIAYDPFYYNINDAKFTFDSSSLSNGTTFTNDGNFESYPLIKITGSGDVNVGINGNVFTVKGMVDYVYVDSYYMTVYRDANINKIGSFVGSFPMLNSGLNAISTTGNVTSIEIQCNSRFI